MLYAKTLFAALLAAAVLVQAEPTQTTPVSINPHGIALKPVPQKRDAVADAPSPSVELTNAQRLARGLPLRKPSRQSKKSRQARQAAPSACPSTAYSGIVQVTNADTGAALGYLPSTLNLFAEYGVTPSAEGALRVAFSAASCAGAASQLDILTTNGAADFPYLGLISGFANAGTQGDLGAGSYNYAYFGGVTHTPAGSPPVTAPNSYSVATGVPEVVESAVWTYDAASGSISAQWVNTDGSVVATDLLYSASDNTIVAAGDVASFRSRFGSAGTFPRLTLRLVPDGGAY